MNARIPPLLAAGALPLMLLLGGCKAFLPPVAEVVEAAPGEVTLGAPYLQRKQTIEVEGELVEGRLRARRIEIEEQDDEVAIKGELQELDEDGGQVGGVAFRLSQETKLSARDGPEPDREAFVPGSWVKVDCILRDDVLVARDIELRQRRPEEPNEVQGRIDKLDHIEGELVIGGIPVTFPRSVLVVWDRDDQEPPPLPERFVSEPYRRVGGVRRILRRDDDDQRPEDQLTLGGFLTIGGEVQYELEWRNNHNLRDARDRDRLIHEPSTKVELSFDLGRHLFAFADLRGTQDIVHFDEGSDQDSLHRGRIGEAWMMLTDLPFPGLALQVGRQDIDHGREVVIDDELDAFRIWADLDEAVLEAWIGTTLFDSSPEEEGVTNFFAGLHLEPLEDTAMLISYLHRKDGPFEDLARNHAQLSIEGEVGDLEWWLDGGFAWGRERGREVFGYGFDALVSWTFSDSDLAPHVYAGIAFGSGDGDPDGGTDGNYRQTGLQDNNDRLSGVTSFRYLGELVRPEVSNLWVLTAGIGVRPSRNSSVDLLFHHYRQVEEAPFLRDTRLRLDPSGESKDIGNAIDLVIGIQDWRPLEFEIVLGYFHPGSAFPEGDDAWFLTFQAELNF